VGIGSLVDGSPQQGPEWGYRGEALRSQIYTNNLQLSNAFICRFVAKSLFHLPLLPSSDLNESHDPTMPGQGGHVATLRIAIAMKWLQKLVCNMPPNTAGKHCSNS